MAEALKQRADHRAELARWFERVRTTEDDECGMAHLCHSITLSALALIETLERDHQRAHVADQLRMLAQE